MLLTNKTICVTFSNGNLDALLPYLKMGGYMCAASLILGFERSHLCCLLCILTHHRSSAERLAPLLCDGGATHRVRRLVQEDWYQRSAHAPAAKNLAARLMRTLFVFQPGTRLCTVRGVPTE